MKLSKSSFRRTGTVVAGAAVGLIGVMTTAMPALACHPNIKPASACVNNDGTWVVEWTVQASDNAFGDGKVGKVEYSATTTKPSDADKAQTISFTGIAEGDKLSHFSKLHATQTVSKETETATLKITGEWKRNNGSNFIDAKNLSTNKPTEVCKGQPELPNPGESTQPNPAESTKPSNPGESTKPNPAESTKPSNPGESTQPVPGTSSSASQAAPSKPAEEVVTEPQLVYDNTCDNLTVGVVVPDDNKESVTVKFTPNKGDAKTVTAKPGETKTVDFDAAAGLVVTASAEGQEDTTIDYEAPADCDTGALAVTGSNSSTIAGGAVLVLLVGAGLFFMARRRKVRFTA
ncbi:LAETG motif-containing sortase-dependent surface protein [Actinoplanes siamensis]|uniref:LPXTG-motif cell wall-anchored protein n=1 Tax=Actinoplanes siamensis TaxID=1223317 RepID=A0A919KDQ0_9ACTN|nr:LAETG motif-containing sortase-dependent surface protein [Actinoplanes siamensis]GIF02972.1 hypothetical protein Asi03nite_05100 [Actinoplanes siamensis]